MSPENQNRKDNFVPTPGNVSTHLSRAGGNPPGYRAFSHIDPNFSSMITTRTATCHDVECISALLMANSADRGGTLYGDWSVGVVRDCITSGQLIIVAMDGAHLLGVLFTSETARASAPTVLAMLAAWPGSADAYVYGPVCIDEAARGKGVLEALHADLVRRRLSCSLRRTTSARCMPTLAWVWCRLRASRCTARSLPSLAAEVDLGGALTSGLTLRPLASP